MRIRRSSLYFLRSEIHRIESMIPKIDSADIERDLSSNACVSLWDYDFKRVLSCLRRLVLVSPAARQERWREVLEAMIKFSKNPEIKFEIKAA